jgi:hypothetical protein
LNALLPHGTQLSLNWAAFTAPELSEQIPTMVQAVQAGLMSVDEARAYMGMQPMTHSTPTPAASIEEATQ